VEAESVRSKKSRVEEGGLMDYAELVKQLRSETCVPYTTLKTMREAADAIEYLQKSRMDLSNLCLKLQETIQGLESDDERHERKEGF